MPTSLKKTAIDRDGYITVPTNQTPTKIHKILCKEKGTQPKHYRNQQIQRKGKISRGDRQRTKTVNKRLISAYLSIIT